jgi:hypothetical protein
MNTLMLRYTLTLAIFAAASAIAPAASATPAASAASGAAPAGQFFHALQQLCGKRFAGTIVADQPPPAADDPFTGRALEMHVRDCSADEVRIAISGNLCRCTGYEGIVAAALEAAEVIAASKEASK